MLFKCLLSESDDMLGFIAPSPVSFTALFLGGSNRKFFLNSKKTYALCYGVQQMDTSAHMFSNIHLMYFVSF